MRNHVVKAVAAHVLGLPMGVGALTHGPCPAQDWAAYWAQVQATDARYIEVAGGLDLAAYAAATRPGQARMLDALFTPAFGFRVANTFLLNGDARARAHMRGTDAAATPDDLRDALLATSRHLLSRDPSASPLRDWRTDEIVTCAEQRAIHRSALWGPGSLADVLHVLDRHVASPARSRVAALTREDLAVVLSAVVALGSPRAPEPGSERAVLGELRAALLAGDLGAAQLLAVRWVFHPRATRVWHSAVQRG